MFKDLEKKLRESAVNPFNRRENIVNLVFMKLFLGKLILELYYCLFGLRYFSELEE